jgi:hypothetical protein
MEDFDIQRFERAIHKSYEERELTENARRQLEQINSMIGKTFKLDFSSELNKYIKSTCLNRMIEKWEGHYTAKKSVYAYFTDICRQAYASECRRAKNSIIHKAK